MAGRPGAARSASSSSMRAKRPRVILLGLPLGRPAGLPDWPGLNCWSTGGWRRFGVVGALGVLGLFVMEASRAQSHEAPQERSPANCRPYSPERAGRLVKSLI